MRRRVRCHHEFVYLRSECEYGEPEKDRPFSLPSPVPEYRYDLFYCKYCLEYVVKDTPNVEMVCDCCTDAQGVPMKIESDCVEESRVRRGRS